MKVFISWSGARSRAVAEAFREWLPCVINAVEPWISSADIEKGARWTIDLADQLESTSFGLICLTKENLNEPWILFEAGALSKTVGKASVCPFLFGLDRIDITGPLLQFQSTLAEREDTKKLLYSMNRLLEINRLSDKQLDTVFDVWWPHLKARLDSVPSKMTSPREMRKDRELLEEILDLARDLVSLKPIRAAANAGVIFREHELPIEVYNALGVASKQSGLSKSEIVNLAMAGFLRKAGMDPHAQPITNIEQIIRSKVADPNVATSLISSFTAIDSAADKKTKLQHVRKLKATLRRLEAELGSDTVKTLGELAAGFARMSDKS